MYKKLLKIHEYLYNLSSQLSKYHKSDFLRWRNAQNLFFLNKISKLVHKINPSRTTHLSASEIGSPMLRSMFPCLGTWLTFLVYMNWSYLFLFDVERIYSTVCLLCWYYILKNWTYVPILSTYLTSSFSLTWKHNITVLL